MTVLFFACLFMLAACDKPDSQTNEASGTGSNPASNTTGVTIDTRVGKLSFTHDFINGTPTKETSEKIFEVMDFQRACQAY